MTAANREQIIRECITTLTVARRIFADLPACEKYAGELRSQGSRGVGARANPRSAQARMSGVAL
jgi:hypothetical protein